MIVTACGPSVNNQHRDFGPAKETRVVTASSGSLTSQLEIERVKRRDLDASGYLTVGLHARVLKNRITIGRWNLGKHLPMSVGAYSEFESTANSRAFWVVEKPTIKDRTLVARYIFNRCFTYRGCYPTSVKVDFRTENPTFDIEVKRVVI